MKIGIITAMPEETKAVLKSAERRTRVKTSGRSICHCQIAGHDIILAEAGMGLLNAGWGSTSISRETPDLLISAGFGGAVLPGLAVGDVVAAEQVLHYCHGNEFEQVEVGFFGLNSAADRLSFKRGCLISCDMIMNKKKLAGDLPAGVRNPLVEMESAAVARVAAGLSIPFLGIRVVSDPWDEELDFTMDEFCDDTMRIRPAKVLATIMKRPRIVPQLARLARNSRVAARSLAKAMNDLLHTI